MLGNIFRWHSQVAAGEGSSVDSGSANSSSANADSGTGEDIEIFGDQLREMTTGGVKLYWWDLWLLGISTAIGGHFFIWNVPFIAGFGAYVITYFIIASAYGMLALCMAELSGALPFAGGAYGITRVTLGTLPGFLVGCFDSFQSVFNTIYNTIAIAIIITYSQDTDKKWEPLWWFIVFSAYVLIHMIGGKWMWRVLRLLTLGSLAMLVIYLVGSAKHADFNANAPLWYPFGLEGKDRWFQGGTKLFLKTIPFPSWFFIGTESINLASHDAVNPKRDVPRAYLLTFATILCTSCAMFFMAASVYPGTTLVSRFLFPTVYGYQLIFDWDLKRVLLFSIVPIFTSGFGFTYYYSSQIRAMGKSGIMNPIFGYDIPYLKTPVPALQFGIVIGMLAGLRYYFFKSLPYEDLLSVNLLGASATYCSQFISFIVFRLYYPTIKREFVNPLGIAGAVWGLIVFLMMFISVAFLQKNPTIHVFAAYIGLLLLYYFLVVRHRQTFSEEEKTVLFKAYLIKTNRSRNARIRTGNTRMVPAVGRTPTRQGVYKPLSTAGAPTTSTGDSEGVFSPAPEREVREGGDDAEAEGGVLMTTLKPRPRSEDANSSRTLPTAFIGATRSGSNHSGTLRVSNGHVEVPMVPTIPEEDTALPPAGTSAGSTADLHQRESQLRTETVDTEGMGCLELDNAHLVGASKRLGGL